MLSVGEGDGSIIGVDPGEYYTWVFHYFVALQLIRGCALGPLDSSALGDKTSSPKGKVR